MLGDRSAGWAIDWLQGRDRSARPRVETNLARDRLAEEGDRSALALLDARVLGRSFGWNAAIDRLSLGPPCAETSKIIPIVPKHFQMTLSSHLNKIT